MTVDPELKKAMLGLVKPTDITKQSRQMNFLISSFSTIFALHIIYGGWGNLVFWGGALLGGLAGELLTINANLEILIRLSKKPVMKPKRRRKNPSSFKAKRTNKL